ncbi:hypothetical protein [Alkalihalobacterium alkalinitrilicum]|uniref:hypothetical protein n=1 Tax=Alkalihalobacterium alkalinitrilicum TaxID=427920 RepID=UPI000994B624|nr:hypothetical protein [Alkalihalobacterium alkalinitrilicum]
MPKRKKVQNFLKPLGEGSPIKLESEITIFKCLDCKKEDEIPNFIIENFHDDDLEGTIEVEIEVTCPYCEGTMQVSSD